VSQSKLTDEIHIKLPDGMRERLEAAASADERRPSQWARMAIQRAIESWETEQAAKAKLQEVAA
jgi:predicted DNA-binding protein